MSYCFVAWRLIVADISARRASLACHYILQYGKHFALRELIVLTDNLGPRVLAVSFRRPYKLSTSLTRLPISVGLLDEAKRWFEVSTIICRFVPDGEAMSKKVCLFVHAHALLIIVF